MNSFIRLQHWLLQPHSDLVDPVQRQRSVILSFLLLVLPPVYLVFELAIHSLEQDPDSFVTSPVWLLLVFVGWMLLYGLSRTGYHSFTIWLSSAFGVCAILVRHLTHYIPGSETPLYYFALLIFVAGYVTTLRHQLVLLGVAYMSLGILLFLPSINSLEHTSHVLHVALYVTLAGFASMGIKNITNVLQESRIQAEQKASGLFNAGGDAIFILRGDRYEISDWNQSAQLLFGAFNVDLRGTPFMNFLTEDAREKASGCWQAADGTPHILTVAQPSGEPLHVEARLSLYPAQDEQTYLLSLSDATEKLHTVQALVTSQQRFQDVFNNLYQALLLVDQEGRILEANSVSQQMIGFDDAAMQGRAIWSFSGLDDDGRDLLRTLLRLALQGERSCGQLTYRRSGGATATFDCTMQPMQQNDPTGQQVIIFSARDITEEKELQNRLHDIERRYDALFERSEDAIFLFDTNGIILAANERAGAFLRTDVSKIVGKVLTRYIAPEEHESARERVAALMSGRKVPVYQRVFLAADGSRVVGEVNVMSVYDHNGVVRYFQSMVRDATQREERQQMRWQYRLMRARNEMMSDFITSASHHFRTPLTTIKASLYLLPRLENRPEKYAEHMDVLNGEVERLERLLNDLLLVVRLQRTTTEEYQLDLMLSSLVADLRAQQSAKPTYNNHRWTWDVQESREPIQGSGEYIQRAMQNVLDNAIAYTPEGGAITVRLFDQDRWAVFEVLDTGIGISHTDIVQVGRDFFRSDDAQERQQARAGLGLSIVRQIMHRHDGTILMESQPGQGTRVQLIWPTQDDWMPILLDPPQHLLGDPSPFKTTGIEHSERAD